MDDDTDGETDLTHVIPRDLGGGATPTAHTATVLVVDDHEPIATLVSRLLTFHGHQVLTATTPAAAFDLAASADVLDLLITDLVMRDRSGRDLATELRRVRPQLPVVFMSGYTADVLHGEALADGQWFLRKPFRDVELLAAVGQALGHPLR